MSSKGSTVRSGGSKAGTAMNAVGDAAGNSVATDGVEAEIAASANQASQIANASAAASIQQGQAVAKLDAAQALAGFYKGAGDALKATVP